MVHNAFIGWHLEKMFSNVIELQWICGQFERDGGGREVVMCENKINAFTFSFDVSQPLH